MANQRSLTAANSVFMLSVDGLYPVPQQIQGYSTDAAFETEATEGAEVMKGVDDVMSAGWVPTMKRQTISLQADSESALFFETWIQAQNAQREVIWCDGTITLPALGRLYTLTRGVLTSYVSVPSVRRVLQARNFIITWSSIVPAPAPFGAGA